MAPGDSLTQKSNPSAGEFLPRGAYTSSPRRPTQTRTASPLSVWSALKSIFGIQPAAAPPSNAGTAIANNPYRARKKWPPDFTTLHPKHQFHYEKTFRRRAKLKYLRPGWIRGTKVVQYGLTVAVVGYWFFFLEVKSGMGHESEGQGTIFDASRKWFSNSLPEVTRPPKEG